MPAKPISAMATISVFLMLNAPPLIAEARAHPLLQAQPSYVEPWPGG